MTRREAPELTVIIPTWNQSELLDRCLTSLQHQTFLPSIRVVDNGSEDNTGELLSKRFPKVHTIRLPVNAGFARAVNAGLKETDTPFVALLNNDTEVDPGWVEAGLDAFAKYEEYSFFASRILCDPARDFLDSAGDGYSATGLPFKRGNGLPASSLQTSCEVLGASAGAAFYRRSLFSEIGLLDEDFYMYLEDVEFSLRARLCGHRCLYLPGAVVYHVEAASDAGRRASWKERGEGPKQPTVYYSSSRVFWITRNRWSLMIMYQPPANALHLAYGWLKSTGFHLLKGGFLGPFLRGLWAGLLNTPRSWRKRRELNRRCTLTARQRQNLFRLC